MKATTEIPDDLYRQVKDRSALQGRTTARSLRGCTGTGCRRKDPKRHGWRATGWYNGYSTAFLADQTGPTAREIVAVGHNRLRAARVDRRRERLGRSARSRRSEARGQPPVPTGGAGPGNIAARPFTAAPRRDGLCTGERRNDPDAGLRPQRPYAGSKCFGLSLITPALEAEALELGTRRRLRGEAAHPMRASASTTGAGLAGHQTCEGVEEH